MTTLALLVLLAGPAARGTLPALCGPYYRGDGLGVNCTLRLKPALPNRRERSQGTPTRFVPVKWGSRHYLVAEEQMLSFCARVAEGWKPRAGDVHGWHYLREGDEEKTVSGQPEVPPLYRQYLKRPFAAVATHVAGNGTVTINRGTDHGVAEWTMLAPKGNEWTWLRVVRASAKTADCVPHNAGGRAKPIRVGTTLSAVPL